MNLWKRTQGTRRIRSILATFDCLNEVIISIRNSHVLGWFLLPQEIALNLRPKQIILSYETSKCLQVHC